MKKYILFDLDGTLTDPKEGITRCVQYSLKKFNIDEECDHLQRFIGPPLLDSFMDFYGFNEAQAELAIKYYRERFTDIGIFENDIIPGIPEVLKAMKKAGKKLAVATSKPTIFAKRICEKYDISQYFDCIIGSELDGSRTNKSEVIDAALEYFSCLPEEAIMIGDREHDILGAKKCKVYCVGVRFGYANEGELEAAGADLIVDHPEGLLALLDE